MKRLFILIRSLDAGGAERQLTELLKGLDKTRYHITVATFYEGGRFWETVNAIAGVKLISLQKKGRWDFFSFFMRLIKEIRLSRASVIYSYLDVANIYGFLAAKLSGVKVVFGVRASQINFRHYDWTAAFTFYLAGFCSQFANAVLFNSFAGLNFYRQRGFSLKNSQVIVNGVDTDVFRPSPKHGSVLRNRWQAGGSPFLIGLVARLDPMKGYPVFLQAAAQVIKTHPNARFVCVGTGEESYKNQLMKLADELKLKENLIWAGHIENMPAVYNALDMLVSTSIFGEGSANVLLEAMACGLPCVATNVGDAVEIIGIDGSVVAAGDAFALANKIVEVMVLPEQEKIKKGLAGRERMQRLFSIKTMVTKTSLVLDGLMD